jgi:hypothetical protein
MNRLFPILIALLVSLLGNRTVIAQISSLDRFITQELYDDPTRFPHQIRDLGPNGEFSALYPIGSGSLFTLYIHPIVYDSASRVFRQSDIPMAVDSFETLPFEGPKGEMAVVSDDTTYNNTAYYPLNLSKMYRTRQDRPFVITLSNLLNINAASTNLHERELALTIVRRSRQPSPPYDYLPGQSDSTGGEELSFGITTNTVMLSSELMWSAEMTCGEYEIALYRHEIPADFFNPPLNAPVAAVRLAEASVRVWPDASATLKGINQGQIFADRLPTIEVQLQNLYPDSHTFLRAYPLGVTPNDSHIVKALEFRCGPYYTESGSNAGDFEQPQPRSGNYDHLSDHVNADGAWVLEIVTRTPFSRTVDEVLLHRTFSMQRIKTRGQITTAETAPAN